MNKMKMKWNIVLKLLIRTAHYCKLIADFTTDSTLPILIYYSIEIHHLKQNLFLLLTPQILLIYLNHLPYVYIYI